MKMLLAILFGLSVTLNAPTVCAHALGNAGKSVPHETMMASDGHHKMGHDMAVHTQAQQEQSHHDHHGDTSGRDDCQGGSDCDGCTMVVASISEAAALYLPDVWHASTMPIATGLTGAPDAIEPPPPRV